MTVKNPGSESAPNQQLGLSAEIVEQLHSGRMKVEELNETQLRQLIEDEDEAPLGGTAPVIPAPLPQVTPAAPPKVETKPAVEAQGDGVDGDEYRRKADALNTTNQQLRNSEAELERVRAQLEASRKAQEAAPATKKTIDDEGYFESMEERLTRLENENKELRVANTQVLESKVLSLDELKKKAKVEATFLDIEHFQLRSRQLGMDLKTERPIRDIDVDVATLERAHGKDVVKRMKSDKAFRDEMAGKGVVLPNEWEKHDVVMRVHDFKGDRYPTFTSAFADFYASSGLQKRQVAETSLEVAKATTDKPIQSSQETAMIPADSGGGAPSHLSATSKWTQQTATEWMNKHPNPRTAEERATQWEIMGWLQNQPE